MGKIIVANITSLDGYYEGPGKNVMVLPMDGSLDAFNMEHIKSAGAVLLGETSYKFFGAFWPQVADNPEASEEHREFSRLFNEVQKVVVSNNLTSDDFPQAWKETTQIIGEDVYKELAKLKGEVSGDIVMFGSRALWNDLLANGLVDELHFVVGNVVLGEGGTALFSEPIAYNDPKTGLELLDAKKCEGSSNFVVRYKVINKSQA